MTTPVNMTATQVQRMREAREAADRALAALESAAAAVQIEPLRLHAQALRTLLGGEGSLRGGDGTLLASALSLFAALAVRLHRPDLDTRGALDDVDRATLDAGNALVALTGGWVRG